MANQIPCMGRNDADGMSMRQNAMTATLTSGQVVPLAAGMLWNAGFIQHCSRQLATAFFGALLSLQVFGSVGPQVK